MTLKKKDAATRLATIYAVVSGCLGVSELSLGWWVNSLAMMADSVNMLTDVVSGVVVAVAAHVHHLDADENHHFGHYRAEPLGALVMGVVMILLGLKVVQSGISAWVMGDLPALNLYAVTIPCAIVLFKLGFWLVVRRYHQSPSLAALSIDSRNDAIASTGTLFGLMLVGFGWGRVDTVVALLMGVFILYSGTRVVRQNIGMLMGEKPDEAFFERVYEILEAHPQVLSFYRVRAHQVGDRIHLAASLALDGALTLQEAHDLETELMETLLRIPGLSEAFLHLEPEALAPPAGARGKMLAE